MFFRKPWEGKQQSGEAADELEQQKMFESISSYHGEFTRVDNSKEVKQEESNLLTAA